jgi:hypothetical protein
LEPISYTLGERILLFTDASKVGAAVWVGQKPTPESAIPVSLHSKRFTTIQQHYPVHELELLAIVDAVKAFQLILYDTTFTIVTNNRSLSYFIKQTTMGKWLTRWKMLEVYNFIIIHTVGKNNMLIDILLQIYEERTADTEAEIMKDPTINKSFSALTFLLSPPSPDQYSPLSYACFTTSNTISSSSVLSSDPDWCNYEHLTDTIATMLGLQDHQALSTVCDDEGYNCERHNGRHVPIFREEAYKIITALEDASLQLGCKFSGFTAPYSHQPSQTAIKEV